MAALIDAVRLDRDSVGGVAEFVAVGLPPGVGEPVFDKLKADLAKALLSLPAVVGFEYGAGFALPAMRGSAANDAFVTKPHGIGTATNRHGGLLGGLTSGEPVVCRVALKPTSSIPRSQRTVTRVRRADRDPGPRPARPVPVAPVRPDGRGDGGARADRPDDAGEQREQCARLARSNSDRPGVAAPGRFFIPRI